MMHPTVTSFKATARTRGRTPGLACLVALSLLAPIWTANAQDAPAPPTAPPQKQAPVHKKPDVADKLPSTQEERAKILDNLYAQLATADDENRAAPIAANIERIWLFSNSDTIGVLMDRSVVAVNEKKLDLALKLLDAVVELAPDYAEGWNRRAFVYYSQNELQRALGDLRRVLALEPNHFKALDGLAQILRELGQKKAALATLKHLYEVHPTRPGIKDAVEELTREVEGQGI